VVSFVTSDERTYSRGRVLKRDYIFGGQDEQADAVFLHLVWIEVEFVVCIIWNSRFNFIKR
ncbi:hypothetical protein, partial [Enterobacter hormaechei]|uniref:hypothetical protein n=1 Tax=Enterobacter hormaechei TaxID=158836 RepID=UPI0019540D2F